MSILINRETRVVTQGITGKTGAFHTKNCLDYAAGRACFVAGVTPGKGGESVYDVPVFNTVAEARDATGANASVIYVPPPFAAGAIDEAVDAGMEVVVCITEGVPVRDMVRTRERMRGRGTVLVGPNCPGVITPGEIKIGIMPGYIHRPGPIGVVSRSGTLTYEVVAQLSELGLGQSTCVGTGGDPVNGVKHLDVVRMFNANLLGIDVIFEHGIETSYREQKFIVIEVKSRPYAQMHHFPRYGAVEDLSEAYAELDKLDIPDKDIF